MIAAKIFGESEKKIVREAIREAELKTSGEIRVFIEDHTADDPLDRAVFLFDEMGMQKTEQRNGILFYIAVKDHKFSVIGDYGIHEKVGNDFWEGIRDAMQDRFRAGELAQGLANGIHTAGEALELHFPRQDDDVNELPDDIVFGKGDQK